MKTTYTKEREITVDEAFQMLKERGPFMAMLWDYDYTDSEIELVTGVFRGSEGLQFQDEYGNLWLNCAIQEEIDPRVTPEGVADLPEPWLAYVGKGPLKKQSRKGICWGFYDKRGWYFGWEGAFDGAYYAIDVRTDFAKEHYPEIVDCYPEFNDNKRVVYNGKTGETLFEEDLDQTKGPQKETGEDIPFDPQDLIRAVEDMRNDSKAIREEIESIRRKVSLVAENQQHPIFGFQEHK